MGRGVDEREVARKLVRQARDAGVALTRPEGLLKAITKPVNEIAPDDELSEQAVHHHIRASIFGARCNHRARSFRCVAN